MDLKELKEIRFKEINKKYKTIINTYSFLQCNPYLVMCS